MKRILLLLIAVAAFGCSSDDPSTLSNNVSLAGGYKQVAIKVSGETDIRDVSDCDVFNNAILFIFNSDGSLIKKNACDNAFIVYEDLCSYTLSGNILVMNYQTPGQGAKYEITPMGNNKFKLKGIEFYADGVTTPIEGDGYLVIQKQ